MNHIGQVQFCIYSRQAKDARRHAMNITFYNLKLNCYALCQNVWPLRLKWVNDMATFIYCKLKFFFHILNHNSVLKRRVSNYDLRTLPKLDK